MPLLRAPGNGVIRATMNGGIVRQAMDHVPFRPVESEFTEPPYITRPEAGADGPKARANTLIA